MSDPNIIHRLNFGPLTYKIRTDIDKFNGVIKQEMEDVSGYITRSILDVKESHIREALIELGWTPPQPKEESNE